MRDECITFVGGDETTGKDKTVERHVVLSHELIVLNVLRRLEPALPFARVVGRNGKVADGRVEPHIEDLVLEAGERYLCAPLEIACDAARLEALLQPRLGDHSGRVCPVALLDGREQPLLESRGHLRQIEKQVLRRFDNGRRGARLAPRVAEIDGVYQLATLVALISARVHVRAKRARSLHEPISKKPSISIQYYVFFSF